MTYFLAGWDKYSTLWACPLVRGYHPTHLSIIYTCSQRKHLSTWSMHQFICEASIGQCHWAEKDITENTEGHSKGRMIGKKGAQPSFTNLRNLSSKAVLKIYNDSGNSKMQGTPKSIPNFRIKNYYMSLYTVLGKMGFDASRGRGSYKIHVCETTKTCSASDWPQTDTGDRQCYKATCVTHSKYIFLGIVKIDFFKVVPFEWYCPLVGLMIKRGIECCPLVITNVKQGVRGILMGRYSNSAATLVFSIPDQIVVWIGSRPKVIRHQHESKKNRA